MTISGELIILCLCFAGDNMHDRIRVGSADEAAAAGEIRSRRGEERERENRIKCIKGNGGGERETERDRERGRRVDPRVGRELAI